MDRRIFKILLLLALPFALQAQQVLTLEDAMKIALENNYSIRIARNEQEVSANNVTLGNAGFLPVVGADFAQDNSITNTNQQYLDGRVVEQTGAKAHTLSAGAGVDWTIFDGFKMFTSYEQLKRLREAGELTTRANIETTLAQVYVGYYNVVQLSQSINATNQAMVVSQERVNFINDKYQLGSASKADLLLAQVDYNEDRSQLLLQQEQLATSKIQLNQLLARDVMAEYAVIDTIIIDTALNFGELRDLTLASNSQLQLTKKYETISQLEVKNLRAQRFPSIGVNAGYDYLRSTSEAGFTQSNQNYGLTYGITARINLFDGLNLNRQIQNAKLGVKSSQLQTEQLVQAIEASIATSFKSYTSILEQVKLEESNVSIAGQTLEFARERYRLGGITNLELREIQLNHLTAQNRLINARYRAKLAEIGLLQISGRIIR
jgi:outer membrane protein